MWKSAAVTCAFVATVASSALADENPTYKGPLSASETKFVTAMQADLNKRFPTAADAEKAGYFRYTAEDDTGAISYANLQWQSADVKHPSQLWYDVNGALLGADYSILKSESAARPQVWGINPGRWYEFDGHIHWIGRDANGKLTWDNWMPNPKFAAGGGNPSDPQVATLVSMGKVKSATDVAKLFEFPSLWDLIVWVKPNPSGAFAEKNPLVHPSTAKGSGM